MFSAIGIPGGVRGGREPPREKTGGGPGGREPAREITGGVRGRGSPPGMGREAPKGKKEKPREVNYITIPYKFM